MISQSLFLGSFRSRSLILLLTRDPATFVLCSSLPLPGLRGSFSTGVTFLGSATLLAGAGLRTAGFYWAAVAVDVLVVLLMNEEALVESVTGVGVGCDFMTFSTCSHPYILKMS